MKLHKHLLLTAFFLVIITGSVLYVLAQPNKIINERLTSSEKKVAAFYYGWYSNTSDYSQTSPYSIEDNEEWRHWNFASRGFYPPTNACSTNTPLEGWYDSSDPATIETHLRQAEWAGLDAFIVSYWGKSGFEFRNFETMLNVAKEINSNVSLSLYFEIFMGRLPDLEQDAAVSLIVEELTMIHSTMMNTSNQPYMWLANDKPVLFTYVSQAIDASIWQTALSQLKEQDIEFFLMADRPGNEERYNLNFQGTHQYDIYAPTKRNEYFDTFLELKLNANKYNQLFAAGVFPGYDDEVVRDGNTPYERNSGLTYQSSWESAISLNPDWITITSWNEWHEGSEIEPSVEDGDLALNQTRSFISEFKSGNYQILQPKEFYRTIIAPSLWGLILGWICMIGLVIWKIKSKSKKYFPNELSALLLILTWTVIINFIIRSIGLALYMEAITSVYMLIIPILILIEDLASRNLFLTKK